MAVNEPKDDGTPEWAKGILSGISALLGDMDKRIKAMEDKSVAESTKGPSKEGTEPRSERRPKRGGFLAGFDRD